MLTLRLPDGNAARLALAALSGAAGVLCFAPLELFWLAPLVWGSLFLLVRRAGSVRAAAAAGYAFGLGFFLAGVSWIYVSLSVFGGMPGWLAAIATLLFCAVLALYPMLASAACKRWQPAGPLSQALLFAALIALSDWLRAWIFTGFPWLTAGFSQTPPSPLAGFAPLIGVVGLSFLVAFAGALLVACWRRGLVALFLLAALGFGLRQVAWTQPDGEPISVTLLQGNVPQEMKFRPDSFFRTLSTYRQLIAQHPAQLTLLPETALPVFFDELPPEYALDLEQLVGAHGGDLVVGTLTGSIDRYYNSAVSLGHSPRQVYSKRHLVPFGEFIPPGFAWFLKVTHIPMSAFQRGGPAQAPLAVGGRQVAMNICYEDAFGDELLHALPQAGILANLSNTAWFGRSLAQPQHLQIAQMRALETGRPMLRATNTGMTAIIAPDGSVQSVLPPFTTAALTGEVRAYTGSTPYSRLGDWPALVLIALGLLLGLRKGKD